MNHLAPHELVKLGAAINILHRFLGDRAAEKREEEALRYMVEIIQKLDDTTNVLSLIEGDQSCSK